MLIIMPILLEVTDMSMNPILPEISWIPIDR